MLGVGTVLGDPGKREEKDYENANMECVLTKKTLKENTNIRVESGV